MIVSKGEIVHDIVRATPGETYVFSRGGDEYLITEAHTLSDILRFLIKQAGGTDHVQSMLDCMTETDGNRELLIECKAREPGIVVKIRPMPDKRRNGRDLPLVMPMDGGEFTLQPGDSLRVPARIIT